MLADIIFVIIILTALIVGYKNGFLKSVVSLICIVLSTVGGYLLYPYVATFLSQTPLYQTVYTYVFDYLQNSYLTTDSMDKINTLLSKYNVSALEELCVAMTKGVTSVIINIISVVLIVIVLRFMLFLFKGVTSFISNLPVVKTLNGILGMAVSLISTMLIVFVIVAVMMVPPCNTSEISVVMCENIDKSVITKKVMEYNVFINYKSLSQLGNGEI